MDASSSHCGTGTPEQPPGDLLWTRFTGLRFVPDYTEHPKPKRKSSAVRAAQKEQHSRRSCSDDDDEDGEVTFLHDFIAGGAAGCASVVVGHPFDTIKVRMQTSTASSQSGFFASLAEFGGVMSLFRGMGAPLSSAAVVNAVVFSSYGTSSRIFDEYIVNPSAYEHLNLRHDPWQKAWACGSFAGLVQCVIICPMEHVKCRLQTQHQKGSTDFKYKGPVQACKRIVREHGLQRLFQGWWSTTWREVPAFGLYFASYDYLKDRANTYFARRAGHDVDENGSAVSGMEHTHTWLASIFAGGCAGCATWGCVYPFDVIKTRVQTAPLDTPFSELTVWKVGTSLVRNHGWRFMFRGLGVTLLRAFPVNATVFPVYEFTLMQVSKWEGI